MTTPGSKVKALCVATRCANVDQFVAAFARFCDDDTFFVSTLTTRPVGLETAFSIQLSDGVPVLRGLCVVREMYSTPANPYGRPGIRLGIVRLTRDSTEVFRRLRARVGSIPPVAPESETGDAGGPTSATTRAPSIPPILPPRSSVALPPVAPFPGKKPEPIGSVPPRGELAVPAIAPKAPEPPEPRVRVPAVVAKPAVAKPVAPIAAVGAEIAPPAATETPAPGAALVSPVAPIATVDAEIAPPAATETPAPGAALVPPIAASPPAAAASAAVDAVIAPPAATETRTPGSELVLPANPLMNLTDESLEGFVDCTLFESTSPFPIDETTPLPGTQHRYVDIPPIEPPLASPSMVAGGSSTSDPAPPQPALPRTPEPSVLVSPEPSVVVSPSAGDVTPAAPVATPTLAALIAEPVPRAESPSPAATPAPDDAVQVTFHRPQERGAPPPHPQATPLAVPDRRAPIRRRTIVIAASALALVALVALVILIWPSNEDTASAREPTTPVATVPVTPPVVAPPPPIDAGAPDSEPDPEAESEPAPATVGGPPIVGKGPCRVTVMATPAGAVVELDGERVGPAPLTIDGPCQRRKIDLAHERYAPATRWVTPTAGKPETVDVTLVRPTHSVTVVTQPPGATVLIDGRRAGTSPTIVQIMGFQSMSLTVEKPGFESVTKKVYSKVARDRVVITLTSTRLWPKRK